MYDFKEREIILFLKVFSLKIKVIKMCLFPLIVRLFIIYNL